MRKASSSVPRTCLSRYPATHTLLLAGRNQPWRRGSTRGNRRQKSLVAVIGGVAFVVSGASGAVVVNDNGDLRGDGTSSLVPMVALGDLLARLDPNLYRRSRQFARICQWFLTHDPVYAHELRRVWMWDDWPGRWGADAGIDLVAEDHEGHLWAIQAKAYDPATTVTKDDINTFLSESARAQFSFRLLIATTNLMGHIAKRTMEKQEKQASVLLLGDLEAAEVDWPAPPSDLRAPQLSPRRPEGRWAYQGEAMNAVVEGFDQSDRGRLIMACGTGKTLTALFINEKLAAQRTLVLGSGARCADGGDPPQRTGHEGLGGDGGTGPRLRPPVRGPPGRRCPELLTCYAASRAGQPQPR